MQVKGQCGLIFINHLPIESRREGQKNLKNLEGALGENYNYSKLIANSKKFN